MRYLRISAETVKIIDRQENDTDYTYVVPAHWFSNSNTNVNCNGSDANVNCNGSTNSAGTITPAHQVPYHVRGATFTLQLPDGRAAVVNCESKFKERMAVCGESPKLPHAARREHRS